MNMQQSTVLLHIVTVSYLFTQRIDCTWHQKPGKVKKVAFIINNIAYNQGFSTDAVALASVDGQARAGNEPGLFRREEKGSIGNIPGVARSLTQGNPRITPSDKFLPIVSCGNIPLYRPPLSPPSIAISVLIRPGIMTLARMA